jgi:hypothetical protein
MSVAGLLPRRTYTYYVRCADASTVANTDDYPISFTTPEAPPARSNASPTGTIAAGTVQTLVSLTTNVNASCRWAPVTGVSYASMTKSFTVTGNTSHQMTVAGLAAGRTYSYYVRCADGAGRANNDDYPIIFSIPAK